MVMIVKLFNCIVVSVGRFIPIDVHNM